MRCVFTGLGCVFEINVCSEYYSYIGLGDFFSGKRNKWFTLSSDFSWFDLKFNSFSLLKRRQTPQSNSKNVKLTTNVIDF